MSGRIARVAFVGLLLVVCRASSAQTPFESFLDGLQETPPVATPGSGSAIGSLSGGPGSWVFTYSITFQNLIGTTTVGHLHEAPPGTPGGVRHDLDGFPVGVTNGVINGDWRFDDLAQPLTDTLANALVAGNIYINIHSSFRPGGEIRGQFTVVPEPASIGALTLGATVLAARRRRH